MLDNWFGQKRELLENDEIQSFSYMMPHFGDEDLLKKEQVAEKKLAKLRNEMLEKDPMIVTGGHYEKLEAIESSPLYEAFLQMPKSVIHHCHLTGAVPVDFLVQLTYHSYVYYSEKENLFRINRNWVEDPKLVPEGYKQVQSLRQYS